ncbi:MAG: hypothetical protein ACWGSD_20790, partial [Thermodesulfobacteriota bacterium]
WSFLNSLQQTLFQRAAGPHIARNFVARLERVASLLHSRKAGRSEIILVEPEDGDQEEEMTSW